ncbi:membrane-associating domain-containing protein [Mycena capillaripes]|nr:membrane-associating domain-containing protein [Mycena capillaripes]
MFMFILRVAQALLALGVLITTAFIANQYDMGGGGSPSQVNFLLFASVWTLVLALPYLTFSYRYFPDAAHKFGIFAAEFVTMIFWFGGFIALAVFTTIFLGCSAPVCGAAQAATTLAAFEWVLFMTRSACASLRRQIHTMIGSEKKISLNTDWE